MKIAQRKFNNKIAQNIEDFFIAALAREICSREQYDFCFSKPMLDDAGYDMVLDCAGTIKLIQIKTMVQGGSTSSWKVKKDFLERDQAIVIVIIYDIDKWEIKSFLCCSSKKEKVDVQNLPSAKHTKCNADGIKSPRLEQVELQKSKFDEIICIKDVYDYIMQ